MNELMIDIANGQTNFLPGEEIDVTLSWNLELPPDRIEVRLVWNTSGKGDTDIGIAQVIPFDMPSQSDRRVTAIQLPTAPYSFSGKLVSLMWGIELVALPSGESYRKNVTIAPEGNEVRLQRNPVGLTDDEDQFDNGF